MKRIAKTLGLLLLGAAAILILDIGCVFRSWTGLPCPGCGTTRAWLAFFDGHVVDAFYWHPLFWLTVLLFLLMILRGERIFRSTAGNRFFWIAVFCAYLTVYLVRMLMLFPDTPPMDYYEGAALARFWQWLQGMF